MNPILIKSGLVAVVVLAGCSTATVPTNPDATRYSIQKDRAPSGSLEISAIPEVIPEQVTRSMAGNRSPYTVFGDTYHVLPTEEGYSESGVASWYGEKFHGHKTSNGEIFDMYKVSAAHKSLPIPSFLKVTNLNNNRSIVVRVNDRGPFHGDRIVDLSYAAALKLGYAKIGTARVQLDAIIVSGTERERTLVQKSLPNGEEPKLAAPSNKYLQVGAFSELGRAQEVSNRLRGMTNRPVFIREVISQSSGVLHRVRIGPVNDETEIRRLTQSLVAADLGSPYTVTD